MIERSARALSIIVPAHNEEARIGPTLREYAEHFRTADIIVVLNGCTDGTETIVRAYAALFPNIKIVTIRATVGKGGAVRAGLALSSASVVAFVDADAAFAASELEKLIAALGDNDAVIGSRWRPDSVALRRVSAKRRAAGTGFNLLVRLLFGLPYGDTQCGAKVFRSAALRPIFDQLETAGFAFDVDILYLLKKRGARIVEQPVCWRDVVGSKVTLWRSGLQMAASIVRLRLRHSPLRFVLPAYDTIFPTHPLYFYDQLRILVFNWRDIANPSAGGAEVYLHGMARSWVREGHVVHWITSRFSGSSRTETIDGVTIHRVGSRLGLYVLAPFVYMSTFRNQFHVIVDSENTLPFFTPLFSMKPKMLLMYQVSRGVVRFELNRFAAAALAVLEERILPLVYKRVPFVAISESTAGAIAAKKLTRQPVEVVVSGVDANLRPGPKAIEPTLLYLGRLKRFKRVDLLIRSIAQLRHAVPDLKLRIAGSGDDEQRLRDIVSSLDLSACVSFEGRVSEARKTELLQSAWALVLPSVMEGWGIVVIEANACGTPAVGFDVPGLSETIRDGHTGFLIPEGSDLATPLLRLLTDHDLRLELGKNALRYAADYSWDASAKKMLSILVRLAADSPASLIKSQEGDLMRLTIRSQPTETVSIQSS